MSFSLESEACRKEGPLDAHPAVTEGWFGTGLEAHAWRSPELELCAAGMAGLRHWGLDAGEQSWVLRGSGGKGGRRLGQGERAVAVEEETRSGDSFYPWGKGDESFPKAGQEEPELPPRPGLWPCLCPHSSAGCTRLGCAFSRVQALSSWELYTFFRGRQVPKEVLRTACAHVCALHFFYRGSFCYGAMDCVTVHTGLYALQVVCLF